MSSVFSEENNGAQRSSELLYPPSLLGRLHGPEEIVRGLYPEISTGRLTVLSQGDGKDPLLKELGG